MRYLKIISAIILIIPTLLLTSGASAQSLFTVHASICEAINPAQSQQMEWRETGLVNRDPSRSLWVMCPIPLENLSGEFEDSSISMSVGNSNSSPIEIRCILRAGSMASGRLETFSKTVAVGSRDTASFVWEIFDNSLVAPSIACNLPPNGHVVGTITLVLP